MGKRGLGLSTAKAKFQKRGPSKADRGKLQRKHDKEGGVEPIYHELKKDNDTANDYRMERTFDLRRSGEETKGEARLRYIVEEVKARVRVTKREIFFIGELLVEAKECVGHGHFQQWIEDTFDFSYDTAKNFMNVYKACLARPDIVTTMKASVLYQISAPGFPADLRAHIFEHDFDFANIGWPKIRELLQKYKAGELDPETDEVKDFFGRNQREFILRHSSDAIIRCIRDLEKHRRDIRTMGGKRQWEIYHFENIEDQEAGKKIEEVLAAIDASIKDFEQRRHEIGRLIGGCRNPLERGKYDSRAFRAMRLTAFRDKREKIIEQAVEKAKMVEKARNVERKWEIIRLWKHSLFNIHLLSLLEAIPPPYPLV